MSEHTAFLDRFAARLTAGTGPDPRFAVYRNTVMRGAIDALKIAFPTVLTLCGEAWFDGIGARFVRSEPPRNAALIAYGASFPDFIAQLSAGETLPYLADAARIDRLWVEAHTAADAGKLDPAALAGADLDTLRLTLHPAVRFAWFETPAPAIWLRTKATEPIGVLPSNAEGILLTRPDGEVLTAGITAGMFAFLTAIRDGASLLQAAELALAADPAAPLDAIIADLLNRGAFRA
jgi:hypothetical protein